MTNLFRGTYVIGPIPGTIQAGQLSQNGEFLLWPILPTPYNYLRMNYEIALF